MIYLKLILAVVLSALPFIYRYYIRPKEKSSPIWRNMCTALGTQMPRLMKAEKAIAKFFRRIYYGMKKSDSFRKFFTLVTLLLMIAVQFVDFSASATIAKMTQEVSHDSVQTARTIAVYGAMMTRPQASVLAACLSLTLFSYQAANWLLTRLHNRRKLFFSVALLTLIVLFASPRYFIVAEVLEMMLLAALVYPNKIPTQKPKGCRSIPVANGKHELKEAA